MINSIPESQMERRHTTDRTPPADPRERGRITTLATRSFSRRWTVLSAIGLCVGLPLGVALLGPIETLVGMVLVTPIVFGISGGVLGGSQWWALRRLARAPVWIAVSALGLGLGLTAGTVAIEWVGRLSGAGQVRLATSSPLVAAVSLLAFGAFGGLFLGSAQWLVLRRWFRGGARWILVSAAGLALGMLAGAASAQVLAGGATTGVGLVTTLAIAAVTSGFATGRTLERAARDAGRRFRLDAEGAAGRA